MDYLVPNGIYEVCFVAALPKGLPSFKSILPFDIVTLGLFVLSIIAAAFVLSVTEVMRNNVTKIKNETIRHLVSEGEHCHWFSVKVILNL